MKPLDPLEAATLYLHAVDGENVKEIADRQKVSAEVVRRTLRSCCTKLDARTLPQAAIRAYVSGQLAHADRSYQRRASRQSAEEKLIDRERRKQRGLFKSRDLEYQEPFAYDEDDED
jgi:hypothetical protein